MRIFIDESGSFGWATPGISLHCAVIVCNSSLVELFRRHIDWKTSILGRHRKREIKASQLADDQLERFVRTVILPETNLKLTVVGIDTRITTKERLESWRDHISHYLLSVSEWSQTRSRRPADRQYKEMSGWLWNRSPENLAQMLSLVENIGRAMQNAVIWFHEQTFESEFDDFEIAVDRSFIRSTEHEVFWREFFRGYFVNKSREEPFKVPELWSQGRHVFDRRCRNAQGEFDLAPILRDRTYFSDSEPSEGLQIADVCANICMRYHRREKWFAAYRLLRPYIVDVNRGPMTLLVPAADGTPDAPPTTPTIDQVLYLAKRIKPRSRRN
jgi:hypothetical protein